MERRELAEELKSLTKQRAQTRRTVTRLQQEMQKDKTQLSKEERKALGQEINRLNQQLTELNASIQETQNELREAVLMYRIANQSDDLTVTGQLRALIDRTGAVERVYFVAKRYIDDPNESNLWALKRAIGDIEES